MGSELDQKETMDTVPVMSPKVNVTCIGTDVHLAHDEYQWLCDSIRWKLEILRSLSNYTCQDFSYSPLFNSLLYSINKCLKFWAFFGICVFVPIFSPKWTNLYFILFSILTHFTINNTTG